MPHSRANFVAFLTKYNKMKKYYLLIAIIVLSICSLSAQTPIKWRSSIKMINETEGIVSMKAIIEPGWHLYGTNLPSGGPKATSFDFSSSQGIKLVGGITPSDEPKNVKDQLFGLNLNWWDKTLSFTQKFKVIKNNARVICAISYMGCNDQTCLPPSIQSINISVPAYNKQ